MHTQFSEEWKSKFTSKGLIECAFCHGTGMEITDAVVAALDLSNDGDEEKELTLEETFCKHCNGYGWVKPASSSLT